MIVLHGYAAGGGIAIGRAHLVRRGVAEVPQLDLPPEALAAEAERYEAAVKTTRRQLEQLRSAIPENAPTELGAFISLHLMLLADVTLSREPVDILFERQINAEWALSIQTERLSRQFDDIGDEYLRTRKQDMLQVVERIQKNLAGQSTEINLDANLLDDTILIAHDLSPADTVYFKDQRIEGFVTDAGGATSHTAILGRSLNIPSVIGFGNARALISEHEWVVVDGITGTLIIEPDEIVLAEYRRLLREYKSRQRQLNKLKNTAATTLDGEEIELLANIESAGEVKNLLKLGADGVGLLRSEFLYLNRDNLPDEDELFHAYAETVKKLKGKECTIRTVDLGVDKNPRWFGGHGTPNAAANPALWLTGIRLCHAEPVMFRTQMRAILRAAVFGKIKMMWPMISSLSELKQSLIHLDTARRQLTERGEAFGDIEVGCMIEIPSAALDPIHPVGRSRRRRRRLSLPARPPRRGAPARPHHPHRQPHGQAGIRVRRNGRRPALHPIAARSRPAPFFHEQQQPAGGERRGVAQPHRRFGTRHPAPDPQRRPRQNRRPTEKTQSAGRRSLTASGNVQAA